MRFVPDWLLYIVVIAAVVFVLFEVETMRLVMYVLRKTVTFDAGTTAFN